MNLLFTVCGRAGSKGCKNKNLKEFLGDPLLFYTLSAIDLFIKNNKSKYNKIVTCVNSDSKEILELASKTNLNIFTVDRNKELAGDTISKVDVIKNCLTSAERELNCEFELLIDLDITSPLRTLQDIENAISIKLDKREKGIIFSVVESRRNPYFNMVKEENDDYIQVIESNFVTRQEAPPIYDMNASIYVYESEILRQEDVSKIFDKDCGIVEMYDTGILDIDSEADFYLMQVIAKHFYESKDEFKAIKDNLINII